MANRGKSDENQDTFLARLSQGGSKTLVGVFDGHGVNGKKVSEFVSEELPKSFYAHDFASKNPALALESAFLETQSRIAHGTSFDASFSGTTAVVVYRRRNHLVVAHVGDSRAVLGRRRRLADQTPVASAGLWAVELTSDQRPCRPDERRRVTSEGGVIHPGYARVESHGEPRLRAVGPQRVWDKTGRHGFGVTRSLGDLLMRPFLTAQPEFTERMLDPDDRLLVIASDGVWDCLSSQEAVDIAARHHNPHMAAREIADAASSCWAAKTQGRFADDITAMVVYLEFGPPPSALDPSRPSTGKTVGCASRPISARPVGCRPAPAELRAPATARRASSESQGSGGRIVMKGKGCALSGGA